MWQYLEKVLVAALVSAASFCFSYYWYQQGRKLVRVNLDSEPIAVLSASTSVVERKPSTRVIWESIAEGEQLYANEAIRTAQDSEAEIVFAEKGLRIHLEPDSVVVLEETENNLMLDFLKGNVFVAGSEAGGLQIKSGDQTIDVSGELNLNKSAGGGVDVQVLRGTASVQDGGKKVQLKQNQAGRLSDRGLEVKRRVLQILQPANNTPVLIDYKKGQKMTIRWRPLAQDYNIELFSGGRRSQLKKVKDFELSQQRGLLTVPWAAGRVYWKIRARSSDPQKPVLESPVFKNKLVAQIPPQLISPGEKETLRLVANSPLHTFRWVDPLRLKNLKMQIWFGANKGAPLAEVPLRGSSATYRLQKSGRYTVVLAGQFVGSSTSDERAIEVRSDPRPFKVELIQPNQPPQLLEPTPEQFFAFTEVQNYGVFLSWQKVAYSQGYKVRVEWREKGQRKRLTKAASDPLYRIRKIKPGVYSWSVAALHEGREVWSAVRQFRVGQVPVLAWADGETQSESYYGGESPVVNLEWTAGEEALQQQTQIYRLKVAPEARFRHVKAWKKVDQLKFTGRVRADGFYLARVQALNDKGRVIAQTPLRRIRVQESPLLPAPEFSEFLPAKLKANGRGHVTLDWSEVDGALEYLVRLKTEGDEVVGDYPVKSLKTTLRALKPGQYRVSLFSRDRYGRLGEEGEPRVLKVRSKSSIRAPAFKKIKVRSRRARSAAEFGEISCRGR